MAEYNGDPEECLPLAARRKVDEDGNILHEIFNGVPRPSLPAMVKRMPS